MNAEAFYERGWSCCTDCNTRRPVSKLTDGRCNDDWHAQRAAHEPVSRVDDWKAQVKAAKAKEGR